MIRTQTKIKECWLPLVVAVMRDETEEDFWVFLYRGKEIDVKIRDERWMREFYQNKIELAWGYCFNARLQIEKFVDGRTKYTILQVRKVDPAPLVSFLQLLLRKLRKTFLNICFS